MRIDLNADLGESFAAWRLGDDEAMLDVVTSANVACGFHAGGPLNLQHTCAAALDRGVRIGAHVSYRDLAGFGRRFVDATYAEMQADVIYQIGALQAMCAAAGGRVSYVKPHGALYHAVGNHEAHARAVVDATVAVDRSLAVLGSPGSRLLELAADAGLRTVTEAFADRAYTAEGHLLSRSEPGAVLTDAQLVADRVVRMVTDGSVAAHDGTDIEVRADSVCTHGDTPGAVAMARAIRAALEQAGVDLTAFAS